VTNIFVWRSGLLVYNVIFIVGPNRLGARSTWGRTGLGSDRPDTAATVGHMIVIGLASLGKFLPIKTDTNILSFFVLVLDTVIFEGFTSSH